MNFGERFSNNEEEYKDQYVKDYYDCYEDEQFKPVDDSIIDPNDIVDDLMDLGPVEWKRAKEIPALLDADGKLQIFSGKIEPNDIKQGQIGDCYFLSSIAALSEYENRIRKMFITEEANDSGLYAVQMFKNGQKMIVNCDDKFPCKGDQVAFARSNGPELWVLLLEKMWAKLHGCYDRIAGGLEYETIRDLTGAPGYFFSGIDDDTFERIYQFDQLGYVMGCSMSDKIDAATAEAQGIVPGHAYTLLSATTVKDKSGRDQRLVKLRNPWGSGEWNGKWSDKSSEWTPQIRQKVGFDGDRDDGIFWMAFEDFKEIYGFWSVNKYMDDAVFTNENIDVYFDDFKERYSKQNYSNALLKIETKKAGLHTFAVSQFGNRLMPRKAEYKYANVNAYLVKENPANPDSFKDCSFVEATITRQDRDTYIEVEDLPVGKYWLYVDLELQPGTEKCFDDIGQKYNFKYNINCYGAGEVEFNRIQNEYEEIDILSEFMTAYCEFHHEQGDDVVKFDDSQFAGIRIWEESNYWETGYNFKLVENKTSDKVMVLCHTHLDFKNGLIFKPLKDELQENYKVSRSQYVFSVPPNTKKGVFTKPFTGFGRGGQAHTPFVVDLPQFDSDILNYYKSHYNRYQLSSHNIEILSDEKEDLAKLPCDFDDVEDEGTAPAVKSGFSGAAGVKKNLKHYKMLFVVQSKAELNQVLEIVNNPDFVAKTRDSAKNSPDMILDIKTTLFQDFKNNEKEDIFDFVGLVFLNKIDRQLLEESADYIGYYSQAPIISLFVGKQLQKSEQSFRGAMNYMKGSSKMKFGKMDKTFLPATTTQAVNPLLVQIKSLSQSYEKLKEGDVKKSFDKFDKDGNGTIDLKELAELSRELGQMLTTNQAKQAFKDLDLNSDGSIDFEEFARWYFVGMKPYNGATKSLLQVANQTSSIGDALKNQKIADILQKDQKITKHRFCVNLNSPPDGQRLQVRANFYGPETEKLKVEATEYKNQYLEKLNPSKQDIFGVYAKLQVSVKRSGQRKLKSAIKYLQSCIEQEAKDKDAFFTFNLVKEKLVFQTYVAMRERDWPLQKLIPESLVEGLQKVDQGVEFKFTLGFSPQEVLENKKSIVELVTKKGLKAELDVHFLKSIHKALNEAFKDREDSDSLKQGIAMSGPAFGLNTKFNLDLKFKEFEELRDHPMADKFVLTLGQIFEMLMGKDLKTIQETKYDIFELDQEKIQALVDKEDLSERQYREAKMFSSLLTILDEVDPVTKADVDVYLNDMISVNVQLRGHGFGEMIATIIKGGAYKPRQYCYEAVHKAYLKAYDNEKYLEIYGKEDEEKKEDADDGSFPTPPELMAYDQMEMMAAEPWQAEMMMEEKAMMMEEKAIIQVDEKKNLGPSKEKAKRTVKSRFPAPTSISTPQADDILGDTEQMKQIKAYIQEQVQLKVNSAIDQEAERQIEVQMRDFKEQYMREAVNRVPVANGNKEGAQIGRIPANIVMGKKDTTGSIGSPRQAPGAERSNRATRKDRAISGIPSNTLRRAESKKASSPQTKFRR